MLELTCDDEGVDGDTVVFVLLVGVSGPQPEAGQEGAEKVEQQADDDQSCAAADIT